VNGKAEQVPNSDDRSGFRLTGETLAKISIFFILASPLVTYSLPETALTRWPAAVGFADIVARFVPAIDKLTALSQFPHVTRLFLAMLWGIVFPVLLILALRTAPQENHLRRMKAPEWVIWTAPLMVVALCWVILFMPFVDAVNLRDFDCDHTPFDEGICMASASRFWLGLFGTTCAVAVAIFIVAILHWPKAIRTYYANK
jgi:hypothetical protein